MWHSLQNREQILIHFMVSPPYALIILNAAKTFGFVICFKSKSTNTTLTDIFRAKTL